MTISVKGDATTSEILHNGSTALKITSTGVEIVGDLVLTGGDTTVGTLAAFQCRAWVNFDASRDSSGATNSSNTNRFIRASGNVTSVLKNGTGDYTITFTNAMPDANYAVQGTVAEQSGATGDNGLLVKDPSNILTGSVRMQARQNATALDHQVNVVTVFR